MCELVTYNHQLDHWAYVVKDLQVAGVGCRGKDAGNRKKSRNLLFVTAVKPTLEWPAYPVDLHPPEILAHIGSVAHQNGAEDC